MEEAQSGRTRKVAKQGTLDTLVMKSVGPQVFTHENLLHVVTQFVTVDDQVRLTVGITLNKAQWSVASTSRLQLQTKHCFKTVWL
jgi:hypothetical protein